MLSRRSKDLIITQILVLCQGDGASKTKIVYQVNMNFHTAKTYVDLLLKKDLLEAIPGEPITYKTTQKGEKALKCLAVIEAIYS